jgi:hypothetical protein
MNFGQFLILARLVTMLQKRPHHPDMADLAVNFLH